MAGSRFDAERPVAAVVPQLCPGGTAVCLGCGPSLTAEDVDACHGRATVIAVNDAYRLAPWADALMASDGSWWRARHGVPTFTGLKYSLDPSASRSPGVVVLQNTGSEGIEWQPTGLKTGHNSGAAAINLAVHFGARRIILLGYDMAARDEAHSHFFGAHVPPLRGQSPYPLFRRMLATMAGPLADAGIDVWNCSRQTALTCFPRRPLAEALPPVMAGQA